MGTNNKSLGTHWQYCQGRKIFEGKEKEWQSLLRQEFLTLHRVFMNFDEKIKFLLFSDRLNNGSLKIFTS